MYKNGIKIVLDFSCASLAFILLLPIFIFITIFLFIVNNGKPFFLQERPGFKERVFKIIKFKTMNDKKDKIGNFLPDEERISGIGKFVRSTSLDEIPQLINVVKGDMSLVGPRPLLPQYLPLYSDLQRKRHNVKPGITGYAQVNGRNAISWKKKFEMDVVYVENISFFLDLKILIKTVSKVFLRSDISETNKVTIEAFNGNN